jgi:hypothetical protein
MSVWFQPSLCVGRYCQVFTELESTENMPKSTNNYWNPLSPENSQKWKPIPGFEGVIEELTLSQDKDSGEYTRLTRFHAGADTTSLGGKSHDYPEEIFIVSGHIYDRAFDIST